MIARVTVNEKSVGIFYQMTTNETQTEMQERILNVITYRYGACDLTIQWEKYNN